MFRRVLITGFAGLVLVPLCSFAQQGPAAQPPSSDSNTAGSSSTQIAPPPSSSKKAKKKKGKNADNPIADLGSTKQPDKVLYDRAVDSIKHGKYDVARLSLQTLINTYPDSEYVARAKLAIGDSWYDEGGTAALAQAESEYKDFITFFPNMPEAAEAQMKIANIHFREMEKADRDPTHALRAEDEYRQLILQFPDSPLVPQAKQYLLEVQEVLARREFDIGHFYFLRENYMAAIARLKSVTDTYPLYSGADEALFELGNSYEKEIEEIRASKLAEVAKAAWVKYYTEHAAEVYDRIVTKYPLEERVEDAKRRLEALKQPVPKATPEAIAANRAQIQSRSSVGTFGKIMENFHHAPDFSEATKVGEPTLVDPKQASAPEMVRTANQQVAGMVAGGNRVSVERVNGEGPTANQPTPRSDATPVDPTAGGAAPPANAADAAPGSGAPAGTEMKNDLPPGSNTGTAPLPPPTQVNDLAGSPSETSSTPQPAAGTSPQTAPAANPNTESTSKKKKKHHLLLPF